MSPDDRDERPRRSWREIDRMRDGRGDPERHPATPEAAARARSVASSSPIGWSRNTISGLPSAAYVSGATGGIASRSSIAGEPTTCTRDASSPRAMRRSRDPIVAGRCTCASLEIA